jgi:hypothetical protein
MTTKPETLLWLNDSRGVYIPRDFANCFVNRDKHVSGVSAEDWTILKLVRYEPTQTIGRRKRLQMRP